ncbi:unnamed protein product [Brassica oleracea]
MMHCIRRSCLVGSEVQTQVSNKEISNWIMYEFVGLLGFRVRLLEINQVLESIRQAFHHQKLDKDYSESLRCLVQPRMDSVKSVYEIHCINSFDHVQQVKWNLLQKLLRRKTEAALSNDYYESDIAWMDLLGSINVLTAYVAILSEICRPHEVINGHSLNEHAVLDGVDGGSSRAPLINVYLLDQAAKEFNIKFNESLASPVVLLVATNKVWYYIACSDCHTKANRGPNSFMFPKNAETSTSLELYHIHAEVSVYESGQKATFVLIGNAGPELIGRHASELFDNYGEGVCPSVLPLIRVVAAALSDAVVEIAHALGAVQVCNTSIRGARSTWSSAEPSASSKESDVQEKAKYETSLNQPQSTNPNHGFLMEPLSIFI